MSLGAKTAPLRQLQLAVLDAGDAKVRRMVGVVEAVADRGGADALIAPLRPRLAVLRPPRALRMARLLFLPLDPLVIAPARWRPGSVGIPRTSLRPLTDLVTAGLGQVAAVAAQRLAGHSTADLAVVEAVGAEIWPLAAEALRRSPPPAEWTDKAGAPTGEYASLIQNVATLLTEAGALFQLVTAPGKADEAATAERLLTDAAAAGPQPLAMMLALLLARLPHAGHLLKFADNLAARGNDGVRLAPDRALDFLLAGFEATGGGTTDQLQQAALLLDTVTGSSQRRPARTTRLEGVRLTLDKACRASFEAEASNLAPADPAVVAGAVVDAADVVALEHAALHLRRLEAVGRRLGSPASYDRTLQQVALRLSAATGLSPVDRLRLAEILLTPDAALSVAGPL